MVVEGPDRKCELFVWCVCIGRGGGGVRDRGWVESGRVNECWCTCLVRLIEYI